ncbi:MULTISPECIES: exodeoxyribonuclease VII small subunit [unclassified Thalassotalea]|uniref:exodeoxyribonuclease VII small subunit n=1 Tax=unclassified Thalassotalea TaxID=2614972 RepID=UPI00107FF69E|nr:MULTISPECIES: exodeoxyribonuclease VII small subunit [unclassified Thalassotalea]NMP14937.1 exodeoxyribonuclease VII small subunit [Thalassotalea sp. Y01]QBY03498.1 exodeoxyribonuclease VII small subunit [Thalassotalea sp. HSM 43]
MVKKPENQSFEESINELEQIVTSLEQGDLSLEDSMKLFERGLALSQASQQKLDGAEQKIQILLDKNGDQTLANFTQDDNSEL